MISTHLFDTAAIFAYCINILLVTLFQNLIWDYVAVRPEYLKENATSDIIRNHRISCNIAMLNAVLASCISFFSPLTAFLILFTRLPMFGLAARFSRRRKGFKK
ncbi:MAG: hypothetical protein WDO71_08525 [Bacteroidota bacterium]